jgi:ABC-type sugar transport system, periplasmic component
MKKFFALMLAVLMMLSLAACADPEVGGEDDGPKDIYVIIKAMGNAYWSVLQAGAEKAGVDLGCNVTVVGIPNEADIEAQLTLLQNAVSSGADAIIIAVADSESQAEAVSEAYQSGIPIVMVDTKAKTDDYSAALLTDNVKAGEMAAEELIKNLKKTHTDTDAVQVAIQIGSTGSQTIISRMEGFEAYWAANAPATWELLLDDIKVNDGDIPKAITLAHDFLTSYPNLSGFFSPNNGSTVGFATALVEANRTDIAMVGFDFSPEMEEIVRNPEFNVSTMLQNQYFMGYDGVKIALDLANGGAEPSPKDIDTGVLAVNIDNVDSDDVKAATGK